MKRLDGFTPEPPPTPDEALDRALAAALVRPALPSGFRQRLMSALQADTADALRAQLRALEAQHARELAELRKGQMRLGRETLAVVVAAAFAAGAVVTAMLPLLREWVDVDAAWLMPVIAVALGCSVGLWFRVDRWRW